MSGACMMCWRRGLKAEFYLPGIYSEVEEFCPRTLLEYLP
jgi:hypothetical protein